MRFSMKKLIVAGIVLIQFLLVACGSNVDLEDREAVSTEVEKERVTMVVPGYNGRSPFEEAISEAFPEVVVEVIGFQDYDVRLNARLLEGNVPDIMVVNPEWSEIYLDKGWISETGIKTESDLIKGGNGYIVPLGFIYPLIVSNDNLLTEETKVQMNGMKDLSSVLDEAERIISSKYGYNSHGLILPLEDISFSNMLLYGALDSLTPYLAVNYRTELEDKINRSIVEGLVYNNSYDVGRVELIRQFTLGNIGMAVTSNEDAYWIESDTQDYINVTTQYYRPVNEVDMVLIPANYIAVSESGKTKENCGMIINHLLSEQFSRKMLEAYGYVMNNRHVLSLIGEMYGYDEDQVHILK